MKDLPKKSFNIRQVRENFPMLSCCDVKGKSIAYLDNAATTQKPQSVIDGLVEFYTRYNANVHRSFYEWGYLATEAYENTRQCLADFVGAKFPEEIVFTRGATEALNNLAEIIGWRHFKTGDEVIVSELEHHSNVIPWQFQQLKRGIKVKGWEVDPNGNLDLEQLDILLTPETKMLCVTYVSNVLGTISPLREVIKRAHANGTWVLVDGTQAMAHMPVDVQDLDCDFFVGSGHKMYGPMGSGFFYGKRALLEELPPYQGGGSMMKTVHIDSFMPSAIPVRFEAGTPPIADIIGMGKAVEYLLQFSWSQVMAFEEEVLNYARKVLASIPHVRVIGNPQKYTAVVPFIVEGVHPHDVATIISDDAIAVRAGYHCCQPLMQRLKLNGGVVRVSLGLYNTREEIDRLAESLQHVLTIFKK